MTVEEMVRRATADGASDIHLICGLPPKYRRDGKLWNICDDVLSPDDCTEIAGYMAGSDKNFQRFSETGEFDATNGYEGRRCRIHIFMAQGTPSVAMRLLHEDIPKLETLGLPQAVQKLTELHKGIVLVTGETGSGKSTTLAAIIDSINHSRQDHIVTLEDPVEYLYKSDRCAINQREVGRDTASFADGLRASLREDPNVILIGEIRGRETIEPAITAAETGHLVFGTLHSGSASDAVDRMVQVFPGDAQAQVRMQLSMTLQAVLTQQLVPRKGGGRVLAAELMIVTDAIRNLIRTGNTPQIANAVATSVQIGGQTMDMALARLLRAGQISRDDALHYARDPEYIKNNAR